MDEAAYNIWWKLHIRAASREPLTPEERIAYETGLRQLHGEEKLNSSYADEIRAMQAQIAESERERARLSEQKQQVEAKIAALEAIRAEREKATSGVGG